MSVEEDKCKRELFETIRKEVRIIDVGKRKNSVWRIGNKKIRIQYSKLHTKVRRKDGTFYGLERPYYFFGVPDCFNSEDHILFICETSETMFLYPMSDFERFLDSVSLSLQKN